jgi:hypothetical protein
VPSASEILEEHIARYARAHPHAAETAVGVQRIWIAHLQREYALAAVEQALERLVARGTLERHRLPDGTSIYRNGN